MSPISRGASEALAQILVVEDDPLLGRLIRLALTPHTRSVTHERSGAAALAVLRHGGFEAVACDISLPDMSGLDVIAEARELAPAAGIVAITGFVDVEVAVRSMKAGADEFLGKPFDPGILWHMLNKAADSRLRRVEAEQARVYRELAYTDALTGCPNRRYIDELIVAAVARAKATGEPLSVAYADIDNFKLLNDFAGHEQGDELLRGVAGRLREAIREPATFGRFGGDEFVVVFPASGLGRAQEVMSSVRAAVARIDVVNGARTPLPVRLSVGIAEYRGYESPRDLIAEAEDQMHLEKSLPPMPEATRPEASPEALQKITNLKSLRNLVKAIDRRDSYTRLHSDHATQLAVEFSKQARLNEEQVMAITIGGPIHDLGKIVVPDEILRKPGPLSAEERRVMEEHPAIGSAITATVTDYDAVVSLVRHHHERFDGTGYPGGLKGEAIELATRIFTLADAFSAMTTDRPYRKGLPAEQALGEILAGRGAQFDPDLATMFVELVERGPMRMAA